MEIVDIVAEVGPSAASYSFGPIRAILESKENRRKIALAGAPGGAQVSLRVALVPLHRGLDGFKLNGGLGGPRALTRELNAARDAPGPPDEAGASGG